MLQTGGCVRCWDRDLPGILSAAGIEGRKYEKEQKKQRKKEPDDVSGIRSLHGARNTGKGNGSFKKRGDGGGENRDCVGCVREDRCIRGGR